MFVLQSRGWLWLHLRLMNGDRGSGGDWWGQSGPEKLALTWDMCGWVLQVKPSLHRLRVWRVFLGPLCWVCFLLHGLLWWPYFARLTDSVQASPMCWDRCSCLWGTLWGNPWSISSVPQIAQFSIQQLFRRLAVRDSGQADSSPLRHVCTECSEGSSDFEDLVVDYNVDVHRSWKGAAQKGLIISLNCSLVYSIYF